jgi:Cryptococcal mannosyltransferase 1
LTFKCPPALHKIPHTAITVITITMAAFRRRSHSTLQRLTRRMSRTYLLQISVLIITLQSIFEVLQVKTWQTNQTILSNSQALTQNPSPNYAYRYHHHNHQNYHGKIFITSLHWNNENILQRWSEELLKLVEVLGRENVFVNIFESGSWDASKTLLQSLDRDLEDMGVARNITLGENTHEEFVARRPNAEEGWVKTGRGKEEMRRIPYLARLRNQGLSELERLVEQGERFGKVLFLGDVVYSVSVSSVFLVCV